MDSPIIKAYRAALHQRCSSLKYFGLLADASKIELSTIHGRWALCFHGDSIQTVRVWLHVDIHELMRPEAVFSKVRFDVSRLLDHIGRTLVDPTPEEWERMNPGTPIKTREFEIGVP